MLRLPYQSLEKMLSRKQSWDKGFGGYTKRGGEKVTTGSLTASQRQRSSDYCI